MVVSEAVLRDWDICTADLSNAFLRGVIYEELAELTGKQQTEENFLFPSSTVPLLQKCQGSKTSTQPAKFSTATSWAQDLSMPRWLPASS